MVAPDRMNAVLRMAVLVCLIPLVVRAEENPGWHGRQDEQGASLFYGIPQTGYAPLSLSCARGSDELAFLLTLAPVDAVEDVEVEVLLQAGGIEVPIATTGARLDMDDSFVLEGRTALDARLADLLGSRGMLTISVEDGAEEYAREAATALIETCAGQAAGATPSGTVSCDLAAWVAEDAPADLAVRAGPGPDHPAVAGVPDPYSDGEETYFPEVRITGFRDGWFRIGEMVTDLYGGLATEPVTTFAGEGWLPGDMLRLWVESGRLWSRPSYDAPVAFVLEEVGSDGDIFRIDALHACEGSWVEVDGTYSGKRLRGWTNDTCASQVTTCP